MSKNALRANGSRGCARWHATRGNPERRTNWIASSYSLFRSDDLPHAEQYTLPHVEQYTGDDEHCRHRQHVDERLRGRPPGGIVHAVFSLNLGTTYRCAKHAHDRQNFTRNAPRRVFASTKNPTRRISTVSISISITAAIWLTRVALASVCGYCFGKSFARNSERQVWKPKVNHGPHRL